MSVGGGWMAMPRTPVLYVEIDTCSPGDKILMEKFSMIMMCHLIKQALGPRLPWATLNALSLTCFDFSEATRDEMEKRIRRVKEVFIDRPIEPIIQDNMLNDLPHYGMPLVHHVNQTWEYMESLHASIFITISLWHWLTISSEEAKNYPLTFNWAFQEAFMRYYIGLGGLSKIDVVTKIVVAKDLLIDGDSHRHKSVLAFIVVMGRQSLIPAFFMAGFRPKDAQEALEVIYVDLAEKGLRVADWPNLDLSEYEVVKDDIWRLGSNFKTEEQVDHLFRNGLAIPDDHVELFLNRVLRVAQGYWVNCLWKQLSGTHYSLIHIDKDMAKKLVEKEDWCPCGSAWILSEELGYAPYVKICHKECRGKVIVCLMERMHIPELAKCFRVIKEDYKAIEQVARALADKDVSMNYRENKILKFCSIFQCFPAMDKALVQMEMEPKSAMAKKIVKAVHKKLGTDYGNESKAQELVKKRKRITMELEEVEAEMSIL